MGTWHIDKDRLKQILTKPIKNKDGTDKLGDGLGDDSFYDFLYELNKKHAADKIINAEVINWLATPDREKLVWLQPSDVNDIKNNTIPLAQFTYLDALSSIQAFAISNHPGGFVETSGQIISTH